MARQSLLLTAFYRQIDDMIGGMGTRVKPHHAASTATPLIIAALLITLFLLIANAISAAGTVVAFDNQAEIWLLAGMTPTWAVIFSIITETGSEIFVIILAVSLGLIFLREKKYPLVARLFLAAGGGGILDLTLKAIYRRPRPDFPNVWVHPADFSFPSGHSMMSIILYGLMAGILLHQLRPGWRHILVVFLTSLVILTIGFSRLVLGAHFPSDILAGWAMGGAWLLLSWTITAQIIPPSA